MKYVIATRGEKWHVERFISQLSGKYWPYPAKIKANKDKKIKKYFFQTGVMPLQLWVVNFPEGMEEHMSATIFDKVRNEEDDKKLYKKILWPLRKLLGLKPISMDFDENKKLPIFKEWVQVLPIGKIESGHVKDKDNDFESL